MSHLDMPSPPLPRGLRVLLWSLATIALLLILNLCGVVDVWSWTR